MTHKDAVKINEEINIMIENLFHKVEERKLLRAAVVEEVDKIDAERAQVRSDEISAQITAESNSIMEEAAKNEDEYLRQSKYRAPRRDELIAQIAFAYSVTEQIAAEWLIKEFQRAA